MNKQILCASDVVETTNPIFKRWKWEQEAFIVLLLDAKNKIIGRPVISALGTVSSVNVHPRDIFRTAIRKNAVAIIVAHCHPSGDVSPSEEDIKLTKKLKDIGNLIGISLLDHVIVSKNTNRSLAETIDW